MQIYFHSRLCSYLPRVPILVEGTVYVLCLKNVHLFIYVSCLMNWSVEETKSFVSIHSESVLRKITVTRQTTSYSQCYS